MRLSTLFPSLQRTFLALAGAACLTAPSLANHYLGANITYACQGNNVYQITLDVFLDCAGAPLVPQTLSAVSSCGSSYVISNLSPVAQEEVSQVCDGQLGNTTCNGGPLLGVMRYRFQQQLGLPPCANWTLSWNICCRGAAVDLAGPQGIYIETTLNNLGGVCDSSPVFADVSIPNVCTGQPVVTNLGVTDPDGDRLVYSLVSGRFFPGTTPEDVTYADGYSATQPVPGTVLDTATGQLSFTPPITGQYVFALKIDSYTANGLLRGSVVRDFRFVSLACTDTPPLAMEDGVSGLTGGVLTSVRHLGVCHGQQLCFDARITDDGTFNVSSDVQTALPGATFTLSGSDTITAHICWNTDAATPGDHFFTIAAEDQACPIAHTQLYSYLVHVGDPLDAGPDVSTCAEQSVQLSANTPDLVQWSVASGDPLEVGVNFSCDTCATALATPSQTTVYAVTSAGGCSDTVVVIVLDPADPACLGLGTGAYNAHTFVLSPNPTTGLLDLGTADARTFSVIDAVGRVHWSGTLNGQRTLVLPTQLAAGPYVLRLTDAGGTAVRTARFELVR